MTHNLLRILGLVLLVLQAPGTSALPNLDRVIATQMEEVAARPTDPAVYNDLGNLLLLAERMDDAEAAYMQAKQLAPGDVSARFNLGLLMQQEGRLDEARQEFDDLLEIDPRYAWAHYQLGMIEVEKDNRSSAITHYAKAFALDPTLTFEINNPHIIDNELATEALLRSSRYKTSSAKRVPRSYGEGARIRELMLEDIAVVAEETGEEGQPEAGSGTGTGAQLPSDGAGTPEESYGEPGAVTEESGEDEARVLSNEDLAGIAAVGQASGGAAASPASRGSSRGSTYRPPNRGADEQSRRDAIRERLGAGRDQPERSLGGTSVGQPQQPAAPRQRYRPSRRSSASLHLDVVEDPAAGV